MVALQKETAYTFVTTDGGSTWTNTDSLSDSDDTDNHYGAGLALTDNVVSWGSQPLPFS